MLKRTKHALALPLFFTLTLVLSQSLHATQAPSVTNSALLADMTRKPNILFILTEDQGAHLGCLGTPGLKTPSMDSLAATGALFKNAFVAYPVCSASKACIYTGRYNHDTGLINNTVNYHKPEKKLTDLERANPLYRNNRIRSEIPTLVECLSRAGYYQATTHKLHVAPVEKFPYDEFLANPNGRVFSNFLARAKTSGKPWFFLYNIAVTHRPFINSDKTAIRVKPEEITLPPFLPDTPTVRKDWAEYLASIEAGDKLVGEALAALDKSGEKENTIVVFMGDHGPALQHGKMTPYDLGLRVPLIVAGPKVASGTRQALASELDLLPTLLDLASVPMPPGLQGYSLRPLLENPKADSPRAFAYAEISHKGNLPNKGLQERAIFDTRWKLIYRENTEPAWRLIQADAMDPLPWGNRTYGETIRVKDAFPEAYRILQDFHPQALGGKLHAVELYDLAKDPDEMKNLAGMQEFAHEQQRLLSALKKWALDTGDVIMTSPVK
jgi:N-sulfoglucosamine sulfohydrolase